MKKLLLSLALVLVAAGSFAAKKADQGYKLNQIRDLALIYNGASYRPAWTVDQIEPYVVHTFADGSRDWLYDGFLFLEFDKGNGTEYQVPVKGRKPSARADWEDYLNKLFAAGKQLDALEECIERNKKTLGDPGFVHKVVLMMPTPCNPDWGKINNRKIDGTKLSGQQKACQWYLDEVTRRFREKGYKNLQLTGIYWVTESMQATGKLTSKIGPKVRKKGLQFVWIPWFKADGFDRWKKYGFDIAYLQPNYFFHPGKVAKSRLPEAAAMARENGMAVEFEADERLLGDDSISFRPRMTDYINAFTEAGVWDSSAIAHYTGGKLILEASKSASADVHRLMDTYARHIIARRKKTALLPPWLR